MNLLDVSSNYPDWDAVTEDFPSEGVLVLVCWAGTDEYWIAKKNS